MKKLYILIVLVLVFAFATPASASHVYTGDKIDLWGEPEQTYPANTAFYIAEMWWIPTQLYALGLFDIELEVDNEAVEKDFIVKTAWTYDGTPISILTESVFNFPDGMEGTHTFVGHWYGTCELGLDYGLVTECEKLNAVMELMSLEVIVEFTP